MKTNGLLTVVIILLLVIISGGGYFVWQMSLSSSSSPSGNNGLVNFPDTPTPSNMQEFTSNLGYKISYSPDFFKPTSVTETNDVFSHGDNTQDLLAGGQNIIVGRQSTNAQNIAQVYSLIKQADQKSSTSIPLDAGFAGEKNLQLGDGTPYIEFDQTGLVSYHHVIFLYNSFLYDFAYKKGDANQDVVDNFNKMVPTIKFFKS